MCQVTFLGQSVESIGKRLSSLPITKWCYVKDRKGKICCNISFWLQSIQGYISKQKTLKVQYVDIFYGILQWPRKGFPRILPTPSISKVESNFRCAKKYHTVAKVDSLVL